MSNFVINGTSLPFPKANLVPLPPGADPTKWVQGVDWNTVCQALIDVQGFLRAAPWYGFTAQASDPAPSGIGSYIYVGTDNVVHGKNGATVLSFVQGITNDGTTISSTEPVVITSSVAGSVLTGKGTSTSTGIGNQDVSLKVQNTNAAANTWESLVFLGANGPVASIEAQNVDQANRYGDVSIATRAADGYLARLKVASNGKAEFFFDAQIDGNTTLNSNVNFAAVASPTTPSTGFNLVGGSLAGKSLLTYIDPNGLSQRAQPHVGHKKVAEWTPTPNATTATVIGLTASVTGTATARAVASTSMVTQCARVGFVTAASASVAAGFYDSVSNTLWRGNAAKLGGFYMACRFAISDAVLNANAQMFVGVRVGAALASANPSGFTNCFGIGCDSADTVMQLYASGSAAQARTSLGVNFPVNTVSADLYEIVIFAPPNGTSIAYTINRLNTGATASAVISAGANLFSTTTFVTPTIFRATGATATAVGIDVISLYIETEF